MNINKTKFEKQEVLVLDQNEKDSTETDKFGDSQIKLNRLNNEL
jgi:hypothetical protein